jgi:RecA/RadA recombinase
MSNCLPNLPTFSTAYQFATTPHKADWLIDGILPRGSLSMLFGDPGAGKTFLALDWSCAIAAGREWRGRAVQAGSVVYLAGEGFSGLGRRLAAWSAHHGQSLEGVPLYISRYATNFLDPEDLSDTTEDLKGAPRPISLIVVDTMQRATPGMNEDRANEVGEFVSACDSLRSEFGAAVLILHHSGHREKNRAKGSIALKGAVDLEAGLMQTSQEGVVRLTCTKLKDGEPFDDIFMCVQSVDLGEGVTSAVLVEADATSERSGRPRRIALTANDKLFLLALGTERTEQARVREVFLQRHGSGARENRIKAYVRSRRRALQRGWFVEDGSVFIPSTAAILRDHPDNVEGQEGH